MNLLNKKILAFAFILFLCSSAIDIYAQGCSDAGFCTIHSLKPDEPAENKFLNQITAGLAYGKGENSINIISPYFQYTRNISNGFTLSGKILFSSVKGDVGSNSELSDAFISGSYSAGANTGLTLGLKIPLTNGNTMLNGLPLPMAYQTSLGTFDIIAGVSHSHENFEFTAALQQPLTQNKNQFFAEDYSLVSEGRIYQSTNNYKRSGDVLIRASYTFNINNGQFKIIPGILPIYHLSDDKFTNKSGIEESITGSQGVTLNGNLFLIYTLNKKNTIEFSFGAPMKSRDARPDGLTRKFAMSLEYKTNF
jgi:hypothetical protein